MRIVAISDGMWPDYDGYRIKFYDAEPDRVQVAVRQAFKEGAEEVILHFHRVLKRVTRNQDGKLEAKQIRRHPLSKYLTMTWIPSGGSMFNERVV